MTRSHPNRRRSPEQIAKLIAEFRSSGLTQKAFAHKRSIPIATFSYWLRKTRMQAEPAFITVEADIPVHDLTLEVISPNGWTLRLRSLDSRAVESLLPLIAQQPCSH